MIRLDNISKQHGHQILFIDASMGLPVSFRPWNNQMRTPILLSTADSVLEIAPIEGFLHKSNQLDTLGEDQPDTTCKFQ